MTRINLIPPSELHYKHLVAEYRELPRVFALAQPGKVVPTEYCMGKGHVKFFYDKLLFCYTRQLKLWEEMNLRGYNTTYNPDSIAREYRTDKAALWNDWSPPPEAIAISRARINERLKEMLP